VRYSDPSGHCYGIASGLRNTFFYAQTCENLDLSYIIRTSPDTTIGQKVGAALYSGGVYGSHLAAFAGSAVAAWEGAVAATPYLYSAHAAATTAAAAHPVAAAAAGGAAETAVECTLTGGGCNVGDYLIGAGTAGFAHRVSRPCSFNAETLVATERGLIPIALLQDGQLVLAYDEVTGKIGYYPITAIWSEQHLIIEYLTIAGEQIATTPDHPFFTQSGQWVAAGELHIGDYIRQANGSYGEVQAIEFIHQPQPMYNLSVVEAHTYFVGVGQWLVHNDCHPLHTQAETLHALRPTGHSQDRTTTAILRVQDAEGNIVDLVTNNHRLNLIQILAAKVAGMEPISVPSAYKGYLHAEEILINYAISNGYTPLDLTASRPVCRDRCQPLAHQYGIRVINPK
jgi:hypothetical protein